MYQPRTSLSPVGLPLPAGARSPVAQLARPAGSPVAELGHGRRRRDVTTDHQAAWSAAGLRYGSYRRRMSVVGGAQAGPAGVAKARLRPSAGPVSRSGQPVGKVPLRYRSASSQLPSA
jgi:hypothetical protein